MNNETNAQPTDAQGLPPESGVGTFPPPKPDSPLRELLALALPTVVTMTSYTLMQSVDKIMVSRLGPDPVYVGAQGNGGLISFVPISIGMGCLTIVNTFVSQNLGAGTSRNAPAYVWNGLWIALAWSLVLVPLALLMPTLLLAFWGGVEHTPEAMAAVERRVELACSYGQPLLYGCFLTLGSRCVAQFFYGMHRPWVVLVASLLGNALNTCANAVLIYGPEALQTGTILDGPLALAASIAQALGIPRLGIAGAAYGTLLGTLVELVIPLAIFLGPGLHGQLATRTPWRPNLTRIKEILKLGTPPGLMFGNEMICWSLFMVAFVGRFGAHHSTAGWIAHQWMALSFMPTVGLSIAVTASVGKCMGMRRPDLAAQRAWIGVALAAGYMTVMGLLFVLFREPMTSLFIAEDSPPETRRELLKLGGQFMIVVACFQLFDAFAMTLTGALRGAGDTLWPAIATLGLSWTIIVGGGLVAITQFPQLGSLGPWIAAAAYIMLLALAVLRRFLGGKWRAIRLVDGGKQGT